MWLCGGAGLPLLARTSRLHLGSSPGSRRASEQEHAAYSIRLFTEHDANELGTNSTKKLLIRAVYRSLYRCCRNRDKNVRIPGRSFSLEFCL